MSDPVTNVQIEDVLSSIRKLVSEEVRSQTRDASVANTAEDTSKTPASDGRLILTPALRVDTTTETATEDEADFIHAEPNDGEADLLNLMERVRAAGEQTSRHTQKPLKGIKTLTREEPAKEQTTPEMAIESALAALAAGEVAEDRTKTEDPAKVSDVELAELEEIIEDTSFDDLEAEAEPAADQIEDQEIDDQADVLLSHDEVDADELTISTDDEGTEDTILPTFLRHRGSDSLQKRVADVASVIRDQGGDWEPEADEETDAAPGPQSTSLPWVDDADDDKVDQVEASKDTDYAADEDWRVDPVDNADKAAMEDATRAHLRVAASTPEEPKKTVEDIAQAFANSQSEPDDWEDADYGDDVISAEDHNALAADDTSVIDEEMLRDMVAEIVRQELQGALGERITRNVRKLVRREIHRALSAHEID